MSEFNLIQQYFSRPAPNADLGVGDDAALLRVAAGHQLAISADMLVVGTHFFQDAAPYAIGWKSMAVNISDMAAMGANPKWATLAIALPEVNHTWLAEFSRGFFACADRFNVSLIGGDTTRGALTISVQIMGEIPTGKALRRDGAKVGDDIWVSGALGNAALGLAHLQGQIHLPDTLREQCLTALHLPQPRVALGLALHNLAHSAIDVSDGLLADLGHILKASRVGATLHYPQILSAHGFELDATLLDEKQLQPYVLAGGDDYELCFTAPSTASGAIMALSEALGLTLSRIGRITQAAELTVLDAHKAPIALPQTGYNHFA